MNLLHSIKAHGNDSSVNVIIEIPAGSKSKIEYDKDKAEFVFDRNINSQFSFPFNYGFIPETWSTDNDPLDAVVLSSKPMPTGTQVETRLVGLLSTTDQEGQDSKLITIPLSENDSTLSKIINIEDLGIDLNEKIQTFYKNYKLNEPGKWVDINGLLSKADAEKTLLDSITRYHKHFQK